MSQIEKAELGSVGTVNATSPHQAFSQVPSRKTSANPGPIGLFAFSATTLILSLYNAQARGIHTPNVVVAMSIFVGGVAQFSSGMWEIAVGNTFGGTAFSLYGTFWMSYAAIFVPSSGILAAYTDPTELASALGIYLLTWFILTFIMFLGTLRKSIAFIALFGALDITFLCLALAEFLGKASVGKVGGYFGVITAVIGFYIGASEIMPASEGYIHLPLGIIPRRLD